MVLASEIARNEARGRSTGPKDPQQIAKSSSELPIDAA